MPNEDRSSKASLSKRLLATVVLLAAAAAAFLLYDDQSVKFANETSRLASEIAETERLLAQAAALAPGGDADMKELDEAITHLECLVVEVLASFSVPANADDDLSQQISGSLDDDVRLVELKRLAVVERDFYREHKYQVLLAGPAKSISSTVLRAEQGPLLLSLDRAALKESSESEMSLQLWWTAYSVIDDHRSQATQGLPVCGARRTEIWLPWLRRTVDNLQVQRESLCLQGAQTPARTAAIIRYERLRLQDRSARFLRDTLRETRQDTEQVIDAAIAKGF